jgi:tetrahydromethanopterin S-methyltransferase subunit A
MIRTEQIRSAFHIISDQLDEAIAAPKCHPCGCLQQTVKALSQTPAGQDPTLARKLAEAREVFQPKRYDCLGCPVCYPAIAANAFAEAYPEAAAGLDLCPTDTPEKREGWPPLPGDYVVIRYGAPVAVCTLNSDVLAKALTNIKTEGLAIAGPMRTENLGIERVIKNVIANPHIRFLLLCGEDTQQAVGHLPGQSLESLFRNGLDDSGRIVGARGKRPVLKNVSREEVQAFLTQVELVSLIGHQNPEELAQQIRACVQRDPGVYPDPLRSVTAEPIQVSEPKALTLDRAGYFVVYPDPQAKRLVLEHYTNQGVLNCVLEGTSTGALYSAAIERGLLTRLDHAAYLGRELARAEHSLLTGTPYVQDAAPGELPPEPIESACGPDNSCGCAGGSSYSPTPRKENCR